MGTLADLSDMIVNSLLALPVEEQRQLRKDMLVQIAKNRSDKEFISEIGACLIREDFDLDCSELRRAFDIFLRLIQHHPGEFGEFADNIPGRPWEVGIR